MPGLHTEARFNRVALGIGCVVLSALLLAPIVQTATKFLTADYIVWQIIWVRSLGHTALMLALFWPRHGIRVFSSARPGLQLLRSGLQFLGAAVWITAIAKVPLTTAAAMNFTAPIMVVMLSIPLLGERVGVHRWLAVFVGFAGTLVIIRPDTDGVPIEIVLLLIAALCFALFQILTRKLAVYDSAATTSTYTVLVALVGSSFFIPFGFQLPPAGQMLDWIAFLVIGSFGAFRHFFVIKGFEFAPASIASPFFYLELIGVAILGYLVFGDYPDAWTWVGAGIIVMSGLYIAHREARAR